MRQQLPLSIFQYQQHKLQRQGGGSFIFRAFMEVHACFTRAHTTRTASSITAAKSSTVFAIVDDELVVGQIARALSVPREPPVTVALDVGRAARHRTARTLRSGIGRPPEVACEVRLPQRLNGVWDVWIVRKAAEDG